MKLKQVGKAFRMGKNKQTRYVNREKISRNIRRRKGDDPFKSE